MVKKGLSEAVTLERTPEMKAQVTESSGEGAFQVSGIARTKGPRQGELVFSRNSKKTSVARAE